MIGFWKTRTWGGWDEDGTLRDVQILAAPGLEDRALSAANTTGGRHGAAAAPAFADIGSFVLDMVVSADTDAEMAAKLADVYSVTWGEDDATAEEQFGFILPGEDRLTVFARFMKRSNPTDFQTRERYRASRLQVAFEATDPTRYGAQVTGELAPGVPFEITEGWAPTLRWAWTAHGAVSNPRLRITTPGYPDRTIRCVATVPGGQDMAVVSHPEYLKATVAGVDAYAAFDNGVSTSTPARIPKLVPGQTVTYLASGGSAELAYWPAKP